MRCRLLTVCLTCFAACDVADVIGWCRVPRDLSSFRPHAGMSPLFGPGRAVKRALASPVFTSEMKPEVNNLARKSRQDSNT